MLVLVYLVMSILKNRSYSVNVSATSKNTFKHLFPSISLSSDVVNKLECLCINLEIVFVDAHERNLIDKVFTGGVTGMKSCYRNISLLGMKSCSNLTYVSI